MKRRLSLGRVILPLLLPLLLIGLPSKASAVDFDLFLDQSRQRLYTPEDGLPATSITSMAQTADGFYWVGGYAGLTRFDGKTFTTYAQGIISTVSDLYAGAGGELWIASKDNGLFLYRRGQFHDVSADLDARAAAPAFASLSVSPERAIRSVYCVTEGEDGVLYFGTSQGPGCVTSEGKVSFLDIPELMGQDIQRILCPGKGTLLFITGEGNLYLYEEGTLTRADLGEDTYRVRSICFRPEQESYYVGTTGRRFLCCDRELKVRERIKTENLECINDIHVSAEGSLCLCADNGIGVYRLNTFRQQETMLTRSIQRLFVDHENNLWFASSMQGLLVLTESVLADISQCADLPPMEIRCIEELDGRLYVGSKTGLLALDKNTCRQPADADFSFLEGEPVRSLLADGEGTLWVGTESQGLWAYSPEGQRTRYLLPHSPRGNDTAAVNCLSLEGDSLLVGTDGGAFRLREGQVESVLHQWGNMPHPVLSLSAYADMLAVGTEGFGLYFLRDGEVVSHLDRHDGLTSNTILRVFPGQEEESLWILTGQGINYLSYDGTLDTIRHLPFTQIQDIWFFRGGEFWLLADDQLYQTTEKNLLRNTLRRWESFTRLALPHRVSEGAQNCMTSAALYLCGEDGITQVKTSQGRTPLPKPALVLDRIQADGKDIYVHGLSNVNIPAGTRRLTFDAHVISIRNENLQVFYYLQGQDRNRNLLRQRDEWTIQYTNLGPGSYQFRFGVLDEYTGTVASSKTLTVVKTARWYQNLWVRGALLILFLAGVIFAVRSLAERLSKQAQDRLRLQYEREEQEHLRKVAYGDYLTGLYNRNYLDVWREKVLPDSPYPLTFVYCDCNNLKTINDVYGHKAGDRMLRTMAELLQEAFPGRNCTAFRMGGDEFMVLCCGMGLEEAKRRITGLKKRCSMELIEGIPLTFCCGFHSMGTRVLDIDEGIRLSDMEMLREKDLFHGRQGKE